MNIFIIRQGFHLANWLGGISVSTLRMNIPPLSGTDDIWDFLENQ